MTFPTALTSQLSGQIANNSVSASIIKYANLTVTILEPLTITEQFGNIWNQLGDPITGLVSLLIAVVGGISTVILFISKKKRKDKYTESHEVESNSQKDGR